MRGKTGVKLLVSFVLVLTLMSFASAGIFDFLTGKVVDPSTACIDSDSDYSGDEKYYIKGSATGYMYDTGNQFGERKDECRKQTFTEDGTSVKYVPVESCEGQGCVVYDSYCRDVNSEREALGSSIYNCPKGCSNGACVDEEREMAPIICNDLDNSLPDSDVYSLAISEENYPDLYVKSTATGDYVGSGIPMIFDGENDFDLSPYPYTIYTDYCQDSDQLNEAFCQDDGMLGGYGLGCPNGCVDGACIKGELYEVSGLVVAEGEFDDYMGHTFSIEYITAYSVRLSIDGELMGALKVGEEITFGETVVKVLRIDYTSKEDGVSKVVLDVSSGETSDEIQDEIDKLFNQCIELGEQSGKEYYACQEGDWIDGFLNVLSFTDDKVEVHVKGPSNGEVFTMPEGFSSRTMEIEPGVSYMVTIEDVDKGTNQPDGVKISTKKINHDGYQDGMDYILSLDHPLYIGSDIKIEIDTIFMQSSSAASFDSPVVRFNVYDIEGNVLDEGILDSENKDYKYNDFKLELLELLGEVSFTASPNVMKYEKVKLMLSYKYAESTDMIIEREIEEQLGEECEKLTDQKHGEYKCYEGQSIEDSVWVNDIEDADFVTLEVGDKLTRAESPLLAIGSYWEVFWEAGGNDYISILDIEEDEYVIFSLDQFPKGIETCENIDDDHWKCFDGQTIVNSLTANYVRAEDGFKFEIGGILDEGESSILNEGDYFMISQDGHEESVKVIEVNRDDPKYIVIDVDADDAGTSVIEEVTCVDGCVIAGKCLPYGYRKYGDFCSEEGEMETQITAELSCENNFQCISNLCIDSACVESGLWQKIMEFFKNFF